VVYKVSLTFELNGLKSVDGKVINTEAVEEKLA
jgi:hypothetical protein